MERFVIDGQVVELRSTFVDHLPKNWVYRVTRVLDGHEDEHPAIRRIVRLMNRPRVYPKSNRQY